MERRWLARALGGSALAGLALAAVACGSSSTVGTAGGPATIEPPGPVVAKLSCPHQFGAAAIDYATIPLGTPQQAIQTFLATSSPVAEQLRGLSFEFALAPAQPVQSVGAAPASTTTSSPSTATTTNPLAATTMYYVHRDASGKVVAVLQLEGDGNHWAVGDVQTCEPMSGGGSPSQGVTATTSVPTPDTLGLPPSDMTIPAVTTTVMSGS